MTASGEDPDLKAIGDNHMPDDVREAVREEHQTTEDEPSEAAADQGDPDGTPPSEDLTTERDQRSKD